MIIIKADDIMHSQTIKVMASSWYHMTILSIRNAGVTSQGTYKVIF
jgi:hypothetical protein